MTATYTVCPCTESGGRGHLPCSFRENKAQWLLSIQTSLPFCQRELLPGFLLTLFGLGLGTFSRKLEEGGLSFGPWYPPVSLSLLLLHSVLSSTGDTPNPAIRVPSTDEDMAQRPHHSVQGWSRGRRVGWVLHDPRRHHTHCRRICYHTSSADGSEVSGSNKIWMLSQLSDRRR